MPAGSVLKSACDDALTGSYTQASADLVAHRSRRASMMAARLRIVGWPSESVLPDLSVMQGTFRLRRQTGKWALFAEVVVDAAPSNDHEIVLGPDIFVWRRQAYGPDAKWRGPDDDAFGSAAVRGARYALERLPAAFGKVRIRIVTIHDSPVDTTPPAIQFRCRVRGLASAGICPGGSSAHRSRGPRNLPRLTRAGQWIRALPCKSRRAPSTGVGWPRLCWCAARPLSSIAVPVSAVAAHLTDFLLVLVSQLWSPTSR